MYFPWTVSRLFRCVQLSRKPWRPSVLLTPHHHYLHSTTPHTQSPYLSHRLLSSSPTLSSTSGKRRSRLVDSHTRPERRKIKAKEVLVIDETGENLGEMQTDLAIQIAGGRGLEIVQVQKETERSKGVYKFVSKKQLYEAKKEQKLQNKKDPQQVVKEVPISTKIGPHDLEVKLNRITQFLEKKHSVRVVIEGSFRRFFTETEISAEKKRQAALLKEIEGKLENSGTKTSKESVQGKKMVCNFRPAPASDSS